MPHPVAVAPSPSSSVAPSKSSHKSLQTAKLLSKRERLHRFALALRKAWWGAQVSRSGRYSLERLDKFRAYPAQTSPLRCALICLLTPIPSMVFVVFLECIPLQAPRLWQSDFKIWLRMACTTTAMGYSYMLQFKQVIPELPMSSSQAAVIGATTCLMYLGFLALLSWLWTFPIPFGFVVTATPYMVFLGVSLLVVVGVAPLRAVPQLRTKLVQLAKVLVVQSLLVYIYPAYTIVFVQLRGPYQPLLLMCLPVIKLGAKFLMARTCVGTRLEDQLPEITVFSIELFNSLYITACISIAGSAPTVTAVIIVFDTIQSLISFDAIYERAEHLREKARHVHACQVVDASERSDDSSRRNAVAIAEQAMESERLLITQKLHFSCEYVVLVEYIECFIPGICMIYTAILSQLPNAQFYPQMEGMHGDRLRGAVGSIAIYVLLETASLLLLCWLLWKKLHVHALYQLAFVLEHQMLVIQAKLFVWVTYSLTFRLEHSGMDFNQITKLLGG